MKTLQQTIDEKTEELQDLREIKKFTGILADRLEEIEHNLDTITDGAESVSLILSNWKSVVNSISLASLGLMKYGNKDREAPLPETLVRIDLQQESGDSQ